MTDRTPESPVGWIREIVLDSPHPRTLAEFWAQLVGGSPVEWYDGWITLEPPPHGQRLSFQHSDETGDRAGVHFDILVGELDAAHERVLAVGGQYLAERWSARPGPGGERVPWRVYADPDGHCFCLVVR